MPTRFAAPISQNWEPIVIRSKPSKRGELRDPKVVNAALRTGAEVQVIKKQNAGSNRKALVAGNARKLDEETEPVPFEKVTVELRHTIQKARAEKNLTQAQLAQSINERSPVIQEYESGKAIPNQQILAKMEKVLGVKLRGKMM